MLRVPQHDTSLFLYKKNHYKRNKYHLPNAHGVVTNNYLPNLDLLVTTPTKALTNLQPQSLISI
jgi:hypothetical protein